MLKGVCFRKLSHSLSGFMQIHGLDGPTLARVFIYYEDFLIMCQVCSSNQCCLMASKSIDDFYADEGTDNTRVPT